MDFLNIPFFWNGFDPPPLKSLPSKKKVEVVETRDECKSTKEKLQWSRLV